MKRLTDILDIHPDITLETFQRARMAAYTLIKWLLCSSFLGVVIGFVGAVLSAHVPITVITPTRPVNMTSISTHLLLSDRLGVIPVVSPTVPKADVTSNSRRIKS